MSAHQLLVLAGSCVWCLACGLAWLLLVEPRLKRLDNQPATDETVTVTDHSTGGTV